MAKEIDIIKARQQPAYNSSTIQTDFDHLVEMYENQLKNGFIAKSRYSVDETAGVLQKDGEDFFLLGMYYNIQDSTSIYRLNLPTRDEQRFQRNLDLEVIRSLGCNFVKSPIDYDEATDTFLNILDKEFLDRCAKYNMGVLIENFRQDLRAPFYKSGDDILLDINGHPAYIMNRAHDDLNSRKELDKGPSGERLFNSDGTTFTRYLTRQEVIEECLRLKAVSPGVITYSSSGSSLQTPVLDLIGITEIQGFQRYPVITHQLPKPNADINGPAQPDRWNRIVGVTRGEGVQTVYNNLTAEDTLHRSVQSVMFSTPSSVFMINLQTFPWGGSLRPWTVSATTPDGIAAGTEIVAGNPYPLPKELRVMFYLSLIVGVKGVWYYTYHDVWTDLNQHPELLKEIEKLNFEVKKIQHYIMRGTRTLIPATGGEDIRACQWVIGTKMLVIVANGYTPTDANDTSAVPRTGGAPNPDRREVTLTLQGNYVIKARRVVVGAPDPIDPIGQMSTGTLTDMKTLFIRMWPYDVHVIELDLA